MGVVLEDKKVLQALLVIRDYCKRRDCEECNLNGTICKETMDLPTNWENLEEE